MSPDTRSSIEGEHSPLLPGPRSRDELTRAGRDLYLRARRFLGNEEDLPVEPAVDLRLLDAELAVVTGFVRDLLTAAVGLTPARVVELSELLSDVQTLRFAVHEHLGSQRLHRLERLERGLEALWRVQEQDELLRMVCPTALDCCGFDRVMLSRVDEGIWRPWRSVARHLGDAERRLDEWMRSWPEIPLDRHVLESDLVRRREAALVRDAAGSSRVHPPLREASGMTSYVAAPLLADDRVVGLLHADHHDGPVTDLDRDILVLFARGVGRVLERADLRARLREQHAQVLDGLRLVERNLEALVMADAGLGERPSLEVLSDEAGPTATRPAAIEAVLTSRELEVLALMATGATNDRIAQRLVIATETVKTHVKRVLRKLGAENRAEAISIYLRLNVGPPEEPPTRNVRALPL